MPGFGPHQASRRRRGSGGTPAPSPTPTLAAVSLAVPTIAENTAAGSLIGPIAGRTAGSTLSLIADAGGRFALSGANLLAGLTGTNFEAATSHAITIRETLAGATNTPRDTVLSLTVTNLFEAASLNPLALSSTSYAIGTASSGTITGATAGSTIAASGLPAGLTVNGAARTWAWSGSGSVGGSTIVLTETLADSANSPRASNVGVTISTPYMTVPSYASIAGFGDSITLGQTASDQTHPGTFWVSQLATALGATLSQQAISGTVLQNSNDAGGAPRTNNGRDRFVAALTGANLKAAVFIAYGFNDARYIAAPATFNAANYQNDYREVVNGLIALGYARADIYLGAPCYITDTGLVTGTPGFSGQTRAVYVTFVAAVAAVAAEYGVNYCDLYAELNTAAFIANVDANDNTHPTDTGHTAILSAWQNRTRAGTALNTRSAPASVTPTGGAGQITADCAAVGSATSYEFVPMLSHVDGSTTSDADGTGAVLSVAAGSYRVKARAVFGDGTKSPWSFAAANVTVTAADTTAPVLSLPTDAANGSTGGTLTVTTDEGNGTLYWFVSTSSSPPSAANLKTGTGAVSFGSQAVSGTGVQNVSATGLTASTAYFAHFLHTDAAANDSTIASGDGFTTAAADTTAPTLSLPTDAANGSTGGTLTVTTNEANGTLYWFVSTSGTAPTVANLKTGTGAVSFGSQAVSGTGVQNVSATGLTASTAYFAHFLHTDAAANDSTIASGDGFTTAAGGAISVVDTFTDTAGTLLTAHTPDTGGAWALHFGTSTPNAAPIISAAGRLWPQNTNTVYNNANAPASADQYAQCVITKLSLVTSQTCGVAVRMDPAASTMYFGRYSEASGGQVHIFKAIAGTFTQLGTVAHTWAVSAVKTLRVEVSGAVDPVVLVKIDGTTVLTVTDNTGTRVTANGRCGVRSTVVGTSTTGLHMDNFEAGT